MKLAEIITKKQTGYLLVTYTDRQSPSRCAYYPDRRTYAEALAHILSYADRENATERKLRRLQDDEPLPPDPDGPRTQVDALRIQGGAIIERQHVTTYGRHYTLLPPDEA